MGTAEPCCITPASELEDVFLHFSRRFESLPSPKSVAEARVTADEFLALTEWFSQRWGKPRMWCESTWQVQFDNTSASLQEMFGAVLLIFASEICRDKATEDAVWPFVTAVLKKDAVTFPSLFVAGQPTTLCKDGHGGRSSAIESPEFGRSLRRAGIL
jgi:hypothetical protein